ncbi:hypothetical protein ACFSE1_05290 [Rhizobium helianthi]|uniref:ParB-like N-terminal domain-containing protein n=1 Tax=Rhizobium helianthi TaxID=1132695 RepID=A0ABW4M2V2_9HYPH
MYTRSPNYFLIDPIKLTPTEEVDLKHVQFLEREILRSGYWTTPVSIHQNALFVMDGHHRLEVAKRLNLALMPVVLLDYDRVDVTAWRPGETITPHCIFTMARSGKKFPHKTTRHIFQEPLPRCAVSLSELMHPSITGYATCETAAPRVEFAVG